MTTQTRGTPAVRRTTRPEPGLRPLPSKAAVTRPDVARSDPVPTVLARTEPTKKETRDRAYFIYLARGGTNGDAVSDWIQAERELREKLGSAAFAGWRF